MLRAAFEKDEQDAQIVRRRFAQGDLARKARDAAADPVDDFQGGGGFFVLILFHIVHFIRERIP